MMLNNNKDIWSYVRFISEEVEWQKSKQRNKNSFVIIFIISNRLSFKLKLNRGVKGARYHKSQHYVLSWYEKTSPNI